MNQDIEKNTARTFRWGKMVFILGILALANQQIGWTFLSLPQISAISKPVLVTPQITPIQTNHGSRVNLPEVEKLSLLEQLELQLLVESQA